MQPQPAHDRGGAAAGLDGQDGEAVVVDPGEGVGVTDAVGQDGGDLHEEARPLGARLLGRDPPDVDQHEDRRSAVAGMAALLEAEDLHEPPPIGQPGQLVDNGRAVFGPPVLGRGPALRCALAHRLIVLDPAPTHKSVSAPFDPPVPFGRFSLQGLRALASPSSPPAPWHPAASPDKGTP